MPKRDAEKIKALVIADLAAGEQPAIVAERHGVSGDTVRKWKQRYVTPVTETVTPVTEPIPSARPSAIERRNRIGELVLELLAAKLEASRALAQQANDAEWRRQQRAGELATFGQWLDSTAFALGDRLAGGARTADDGDSDDNP